MHFEMMQLCDVTLLFAYQIQREAEEAQRMLSVHTGTLHHTATQTATPQASVKTDPMASSGKRL